MIDLYSFSVQQKKKFVTSFFRRKFVEKAKEGKGILRPLIEADELVCYSKFRIPHCFILGVILTLTYTIGLFLWVRYRMNRQTMPGPVEKTDFIHERGKAIFLLCENFDIKKRIVDYYRQEQNAIVIPKVNPDHFPTIPPLELIRHLCRVTSNNFNKAKEYYQLLGGDEKPGSDQTKRIYLSVMVSGNVGLIVLDNFLKRESREFEKKFMELISRLESENKLILYLSIDMYESANNINSIIDVKGYKAFSPDFSRISLR